MPPHEVIEPRVPHGAKGDVLWQRLTEAGDAVSYCRAWLALQCGEINNVKAALLLLADEAKSFVPAAVWPGEQTDVTYLGPVAQRCLTERAGHVEHTSDGSGHIHVGYPIEGGGQLSGAVVLDLAACDAAELQAVLRALHWGAGRIEVMLLQRRLEEQDRALARAALALDLAVSVGEQPRLDEAAMQLANELASRLNCERVAVGIEKGGRVRLQSLSSAAWFEKKADFVLALENAMEEAMDQGRSVAYPPLPNTEGTIAVAHRDLVKQGAAYSTVLAVCGRSIGAILCLVDTPRDVSLIAAMEAVAVLIAPNLEARRELSGWLAGRWIDAVRSFWRGVADPRRPSFRVGVGMVALLLIFLIFAHGEYRVNGQALVEGEVQRAIVAPFDGFIANSSVRAGHKVQAGDVLAVLDDRDLVLERQKWISEREQVERKYRDALAKQERSSARILSSQLAESSARLALTEEKLLRAKLTAPFAGIVVTGDLSQMLGSPVERGKLLFEVAPLDAYRVILKVPETEIREVRSGQSGQIVLSGMSEQAIPFKVKNVGIAVAEDGQNLYRVEAQLEDARAGLRPGMEGVGKVVVGERRLIWIWTHSFVNWLSLKFWHWLP